MGKTKLSPQRLTKVKQVYIGHVLIFCEGMTEKLYFDYFADIIKKNKFTDIHVEIESADGNARTVLNFAENYLGQEENSQKYSNYQKYLVFDCDDPPNIQQVIMDMLSADKDYSLLISNFLFETWLLMHFELVDEKLSKKMVYQRLESYLVNGYEKANNGIIREIIQQGSVEEAIKNAYMLAEKYKGEGKVINSNIEEMNPYTNVHALIEQFMTEISL